MKKHVLILIVSLFANSIDSGTRNCVTTETTLLKSGVQTILIGGIAAATAFGIARVFSN